MGWYLPDSYKQTLYFPGLIISVVGCCRDHRRMVYPFRWDHFGFS